jgi:uncharacterized membrane protein YccC
MPARRHLSGTEVTVAVADSAVLAAACLLTYWLVSQVLSLIHAVPRTDDLVGSLWAVIATVFVCRFSYHQTIPAAVARLAATLAGFLLCLVYLIFLPFHVWALAVLIGLSALAVTLIGRPGDAVTAAITTAVIMFSAEVSPHDAWQQPILRFADTVVGVAVGVAAAWIALRVIRPRIAPGSGPPDAADAAG